MATDGFYNRISGVDDYDADDGTNPFDGGFLADGFANTLADKAISFYKEDLHSTLQDDVTPDFLDRIYYRATPSFVSLADDAGLHQHIKTHAVTFDSGFLSSQIRSSLSGMIRRRLILASSKICFMQPSIVVDSTLILTGPDRTS